MSRIRNTSPIAPALRAADGVASPPNTHWAWYIVKTLWRSSLYSVTVRQRPSRPGPFHLHRQDVRRFIVFPLREPRIGGGRIDPHSKKRTARRIVSTGPAPLVGRAEQLPLEVGDQPQPPAAHRRRLRPLQDLRRLPRGVDLDAGRPFPGCLGQHTVIGAARPLGRSRDIPDRPRREVSAPIIG